MAGAPDADGAGSPNPRPYWAQVLAALRESQRLTQVGWGMRLHVSRATVSRWETGQTPPDADSEQQLISYCREHGLFRHFRSGVLDGVTVSDEWLRALLADARLGGALRPPPPSDERSATPAVADERPANPATGSHLNQAASPLKPPVLTAPATLPVPPARIYGREVALRDVIARLMIDKVRLLTLYGPGGVGKTRLAQAAAHQLSHHHDVDVRYVALEAITDPHQVLRAIISTLELPERGNRSALQTLVDHLRDAPLLLVLDNFEQVLAAGTEIASLLEQCPGLQVLATSRAPLHLRAETVFDVSPLAIPSLPDPDETEFSASSLSIAELQSYAAVQLFVERAQAASPSFALTEHNKLAVASLCVALDGLPLALQLAAARVRAFPVEHLAAQLDRRLRVLVSGPVDLPHRQQSLRAVMEWSHELLSADEQVLFRRLAVFAGGWTLDALSPVCLLDDAHHERLTDSVFDAHERLVQQSLVTAEHDGESVRFRYLETVREYALEKLRQDSESTNIDELHARHLLYYRRLSQQANREFTGRDQSRWYGRMQMEHANLRTALQTALTSAQGHRDGFRLCAALTAYWGRGHLKEAGEWCTRLLALDVEHDTLARAALVSGAAQLELYRGGYRGAVPLLDEAIRLGRLLNVPQLLAHGLLVRAIAHAVAGEVTPASACAAEALALARASGDHVLEAMALMWNIRVHNCLLNIPAAQEMRDAAIAIHGVTGDDVHLASTMGRSADLHLLQGELEEALRDCEHALALWRSQNNHLGTSQVLATLGRVQAARGDIPAAVAAYAEGLEIAKRSASVLEVSWLLSGIAGLFVDQGVWQAGAALFGFAQTQGEAIGVHLCALHPHEHDHRLALLCGDDGLPRERDIERYWTAGTAWHLDRAIGFAAEELRRYGRATDHAA